MFSKDTQFQALSVYNVGHLITNHVSHVCDLTGKYDPYLLFSMCVANSSFFPHEPTLQQQNYKPHFVMKEKRKYIGLLAWSQ